MDVKFPIGSSVVVECSFPPRTYAGKVVKSLYTIKHSNYYKVLPNDNNEEPLWVAERRLMLESDYDDGTESWDMC